VKKFSISAATSAKWFQCKRVMPVFPKVGEEQSGDKSFADASVGARYENSSAGFAMRHEEKLASEFEETARQVSSSAV